VVLDRLSPPLRAWAGRRLVPKVLVATQTRVLEAVVDEAGGLLPSVPVLTVSARSGRADDLWRIGALLCAPPATLVAARRHLGAGRNATALRLAASDVLALPLPAGREPWDRAAGAFEQASAAEAQAQRNDLLHRCAHLMCEAYGLEDDGELVAWWSARLPRPRTAAPGP
jgi:hypothetical protein